VIGGKLEPKKEDFVPAAACEAGQLSAAGLKRARLNADWQSPPGVTS